MARPLKMLLVEDSERDAALLLLYLRRGGFEPEITRVTTRLELRHRLEGAEFDLIVSDFHLPNFDGFGTIEVVKESGKSIPLIVLSGELAPNVISGIESAGGSFVPKYEMRNIVPVIERVLGAST